MGKSKNVKTSKSGLYWCNVIIESGEYKIVIAELIDKENMIFKLLSNSSKIAAEKTWTKSEEKKGWYFKEVFEREIETFFNWYY